MRYISFHDNGSVTLGYGKVNTLVPPEKSQDVKRRYVVGQGNYRVDYPGWKCLNVHMAPAFLLDTPQGKICYSCQAKAVYVQ